MKKEIMRFIIELPFYISCINLAPQTFYGLSAFSPIFALQTSQFIMTTKKFILEYILQLSRKKDREAAKVFPQTIIIEIYYLSSLLSLLSAKIFLQIIIIKNVNYLLF